jgi:rubrerythrin
MRLTPRNVPALAQGPGIRTLPLSIASRTRRVVEQALSAAWREVAMTFDVSALTEAEITTEVVNAMNRFLDDPAVPVPGFTGSVFETIQRGGETQNYSGKHIEKRPDISVRLQGQRPPAAIDRAHYAIFVECKILDATHSLSDYCNNGVHRFVNGDYAWAMTHAMMVAYIRGHVAEERLLRHVADTKYACEVCGDFVVGPDAVARVAETRHSRLWTYPANSAEPGPVVLVHLWLSIPVAATPSIGSIH